MSNKKFIFALIAGAFGTPTVSTAKPSERELAGLRAARHQEHTLEKTIANLRRPSSSSLSSPSTNSSLFLILITLCVVAGNVQADTRASVKELKQQCGDSCVEDYLTARLIGCLKIDSWDEVFKCWNKEADTTRLALFEHCSTNDNNPNCFNAISPTIEKADKRVAQKINELIKQGTLKKFERHPAEKFNF